MYYLFIIEQTARRVESASYELIIPMPFHDPVQTLWYELGCLQVYSQISAPLFICSFIQTAIQLKQGDYYSNNEFIYLLSPHSVKTFHLHLEYIGANM